MGLSPVILAAHGCGDASLTNRLVRETAGRVAELSQRSVVAGFNLGSPTFEEASEAAGPSVVVPLMLAEGYFSREVLPARLGLTPRGGAAHTILPVVGSWDEVRARVVDRAVRTLQRGKEPHRPTVGLVVGHGTRRNPESGASTRRIAQAIADQSGVKTDAVFLDEDPLLENVRLGPDAHVVVTPWLLGGGGHALEDIPERLGLAATRDEEAGAARHVTDGDRRFVLLPAVLHEPDLADLICARLASMPVGGTA